MDDIHALVLTYNRRDLVLDCIRSLLAQTRPLKGIIVLDNASTDGTCEAIRELNDPRIELVQLHDNIGPAGGFAVLLQYAFEVAKVTWGYLMDDDVLCSSTAVEELAVAYERNFTSPDQVGYLQSQIFDGEGAANNVPHIDNTPGPDDACPDWGRFLSQGMVGIQGGAVTCILIPHTTYERSGGLIREFTTLGEDFEWTLRVTKQRPAFLVGRSHVQHLRAYKGVISIFRESDPDRYPRFYYLYRNMMYIRRKYMGRHTYALFAARGLLEGSRLVARGDVKKAQYVLRGTLSGLVFKPVADRDPAAHTRGLPLPLYTVYKAAPRQEQPESQAS